MPEDLHFKDKEAYRRWTAYRHIHGIPSKSKAVFIGGKRHAVKHSKRSRRRS